MDSIARGPSARFEPGDHPRFWPHLLRVGPIDVATLSCGAITVPIYETDSAQQIAHILADADVRIVITATTQQAELRSPCARRGPQVFSLIGVPCPDEYARGVSAEQVRARTNAVTLSDERRSSTRRAMACPRVWSSRTELASPMLQAYDFPPNPHQRPEVAPALPAGRPRAAICHVLPARRPGIAAFSPTPATWSTTSRRSPTIPLAVPRHGEGLLKRRTKTNQDSQPSCHGIWTINTSR